MDEQKIDPEMKNTERPKYKLEIIDQERGYNRFIEINSIADLLEEEDGTPRIETWLLEVRDATN